MDGAGSSLIAVISTSYIPGSKSHGKPSDRRDNQAEGGYGTYGASVGTGGARSATVAGSHKSGSAEPEPTAASGTITGYVAAAGLDNPDIDVFAASNIFHILHLSGGESHGKPSSRGRGDSTENGCRPHGASVETGGARSATVAGSHKSGSTEPESSAACGTITRYIAAAGGTITRYVAAADLDRPDIDVFTASNIFHIFHLSGSESHGKSSSRGRGDSTENRCCIHGASDSAGGARSATIAEGRKSGSAESESTAAGGTITGYVAAANMDNPDDDVFAASDIVHFSGSESHGKPSGGRSDTTEDRSRTYGASVGTGGARSATVAEGRKSGSAEPESAVASGTIARYVAATGLDNSDVAVFTA